MAKVTCEACGSSFPLDRVKDLQNCPICGESLLGDSSESSKDKELNFGEGIELGENDCFDEDKIDFWWYEIREPKTLDKSDTGNIYVTCTKCGHLAGSKPYPIAKTKNYYLIDSRCEGKCSRCGNELKNHILSKRPADWVDPRKRDMWTKDYENIPKCPTCNSTNIKKISATSKVASVAMWGVLSRKVHKQWHCNICGSEW